ncbi:hypothetical protein [Streptomyces dubilierae]|uniref:Uncharacterized protein n=1 Tax=Streptomyces dubilierae TaxID=3075533 RepID=A0ABU2PBK5_9ACTN|nr:hypothetical protein [Streptomyces sp. DSM 41921]MDT0389541.1 hypothetical protein [Streptomyces sp. DSM 41921]
MRERPDGVGEMGERDEPRAGTSRRLDLSVPQVAGGALAAVLAAKLASYFGVYGTILGAGVVSVVATCGGSLFQHFFKRTGEQLRGATAVPATPAAVSAPQSPSPSGEFTRGTVYRARARGWKRPLLAAAVVFGVAMAGITTYELASGHPLGGGRSTTVGDAFSGGGDSAPDSGGSGKEKPGTSGGSPTPEGSDAGSEGDGGATDVPSTGSAPGGDVPPSPGGSGGSVSGSTPTPGETGSEDPERTTPGASPTPPAPAASSRSGTADQDPGGPAAP